MRSGSRRAAESIAWAPVDHLWAAVDDQTECRLGWDVAGAALDDDSRLEALNTAAITNVHDGFLHGQSVSRLRAGRAAQCVVWSGLTGPEKRLMQERCSALGEGDEGPVGSLEMPGAATNGSP